MATAQTKPKLLIHGGAGTLPKDYQNPKVERAYHKALQTALTTGFKILQKQGSSLDAVTAAVKKLENSELFNAGYGSVLTQTGSVECDASIMDGSNLKAGTVAGVSHIKNPITLAKLIMDQSKHVMLIGKRAEMFAKKHGINLIDAQELISQQQLDHWKAVKRKTFVENKFGTVGAVALDLNGNLAAATSTGGIMNKLPGRVGDSAIIGAGTYANNHICAVSGTGHGEIFMRLLLSYDIAAQINYKKISLEKAAKNAIKKLADLNGKGGIIALDHLGNHSMLFNTDCMYRGMIDSEQILTAINI